MTGVRLSLAKITDASSIADMSRRYIETGLPRSWTEDRVARCIRHADCAALVARDHRRLAGFAIMEFLDEHAHLSLLAVQAGYRQRGIGAALVRWLEGSARTAGIFVIRLELRADNDVARAFYEHLGYREVGRRKAYYSGVEDALCMARDLAVEPESRA
jgi:ribosomal-protein-alanine N-acetyltransferase